MTHATVENYSLWSERELTAEVRSLVAASRSILETAERERRTRTGDEEAELRRLDAEMDRIERAREDQAHARAQRLPRAGHDGLDYRTTAQGSGSAWRDLKTGREIRALLPHEKLADAVDVPADQRGLKLGRFLRGIVTGNWQGAEAEQRAAMQVGVFSAAGALVPAPLSAQIWDLARAQSVVMRLGANTIPMSSTTLDIARVTGDPTAYWMGGDEVRTSGITESSGSFGRAQLQAQTLAILERLSIELAEDAPNIEALLEAQISKALALELDRAILFGTATRDGLRTWLTNDSTNSIGEVVQGSGNGLAITTFAPFVSAISAILTGNYPGDLNQLGAVMAPRTWATIEGLVEATTGAPLRGPASYEGLRKLVSTQCPVTETQGNVATASTAFVGDFSQVLVGVRTEITVEASREAGDAFSRLHVLLRGYMRADWQVIQPKFLTRIVGIIP